MLGSVRKKNKNVKTTVAAMHQFRPVCLPMSVCVLDSCTSATRVTKHSWRLKLVTVSVSRIMQGTPKFVPTNSFLISAKKGYPYLCKMMFSRF